MSLATFPLGDPSIAQVGGSEGSGKKTPPKRTATAVADRQVAPEPR